MMGNWDLEVPKTIIRSAISQVGENPRPQGVGSAGRDLCTICVGATALYFSETATAAADGATASI